MVLFLVEIMPTAGLANPSGKITMESKSNRNILFFVLIIFKNRMQGALEWRHFAQTEKTRPQTANYLQQDKTMVVFGAFLQLSEADLIK